jgi:thioredoxin-like negative regulator of GroEL
MLSKRRRMPGVLHIATADAWDRIYNGVTDKLVVVCFTASWCGPCKRLAPEYSQMAVEYPDVRFVKIDVDAARAEIPAIATVKSLPSFVLVRNQEQVGSMKGAHLQQLKKMINAHR